MDTAGRILSARAAESLAHGRDGLLVLRHNAEYSYLNGGRYDLGFYAGRIYGALAASFVLAVLVVRMQQLFDKGAPLRESVDVNDIIREMSVLLRGEAARYAVSIRTELTENLSQIAGDRVQLKQVLMNLMVNGIEAMNDGDRTRELTIKSQRAENGQIMVSVSDTGAGLPLLPVNQIFNAFFTTKPHSIGIGLSISRSIIEEHGGHLWATNNSSRGANFHNTLPIEGAQAPSAPDTRKPTPIDQGPQSIRQVTAPPSSYDKLIDDTHT